METAAEALVSGKTNDALECYSAALEQEPGNVQAHGRFGADPFGHG